MEPPLIATDCRHPVKYDKLPTVVLASASSCVSQRSLKTDRYDCHPELYPEDNYDKPLAAYELIKEPYDQHLRGKFKEMQAEVN